MRHLTGLAVTGLTLVLALPAAAQDRPVEGGEYRQDAMRAPMQLSRPPGPPPRADTRIVGGLRLAKDAELGVGLFSVVGPSEREIVRRRTDPGADFRARDGRSAGLGLTLRF